MDPSCLAFSNPSRHFPIVETREKASTPPVEVFKDIGEFERMFFFFLFISIVLKLFDEFI